MALRRINKAKAQALGRSALAKPAKKGAFGQFAQRFFLREDAMTIARAAADHVSRKSLQKRRVPNKRVLE